MSNHQAPLTLAGLSVRLRENFPELSASSGPIWVAYSGGLDSTVLLAALVHSNIPVNAIHINHQLSRNADQWQAHCERQCAALGVLCQSRRVSVQDQGEGLEAAARTCRYRVFEELLAEGGLLLTGHHQDDQAETLLLRQLRGAGVAGMGAMRSRRPLAVGQLLRPLLAYTRAQLLACARAQGLCWIEDESNSSLDFDRNFLRHQVMPLLRQRWPQHAASFSQSARHCQEATELLADVAKADLARLDPRRERWGVSIELTPLWALTDARRNNCLRNWLGRYQLTLTAKQLAQLVHQWQYAADDGQPAISLGNRQLTRFQGRGYLMPPLDFVAPPSGVSLYPEQVLRLGPFSFSLVPAEALGLSVPAEGHWTLRTRAPGDRCWPAWRQRSQSLKKCLQESALAPWLRPCVPLVCAPSNPEEIWAVGDLWLDRRAPVTKSGGYLPRWWVESPDF